MEKPERKKREEGGQVSVVNLALVYNVPIQAGLKRSLKLHSFMGLNGHFWT